MRKWIGKWWKKEIAVFAAMGTIWGVVAACGIVPKGYGLLFLIATIILSIIISGVWTIISVYKSDSKTQLEINHREGSRRSLTNKYKDKKHKYTYIFRQDLLDYSTSNKSGRDFVSIRVLKGRNVSSNASDGIVYFECTEYKTYCKDIKIEAIDVKTSQPLRVEFIDINDNNKYFEFPFKIFFATPLQKDEEFEIAFSISLLNELDVLKEDDEIMSISLSRYSKGVEKIEFNVCLNFQPASVHVEHKKGNIFEYDNNEVKVEQYIPLKEIEKKFDIKWSDIPYIIRWQCRKPKYELYVINYRK